MYKVPLYASPVSDPNAWDIDALNINWSGLTAYAYPSMALLHRVIQKFRQSSCLIIVIAQGWPGMLWFWGLLKLPTEISVQFPLSRTLLKQSHSKSSANWDNSVFEDNIKIFNSVTPLVPLGHLWVRPPTGKSLSFREGNLCSLSFDCP